MLPAFYRFDKIRLEPLPSLSYLSYPKGQSEVEELTRKGIESVALAIPEGFGADEITAGGRLTPIILSLCALMDVRV